MNGYEMYINMDTILQPIGLNLSEKNTENRKIYFINNPDGSPRWIWNAENPNPDFLHFYNISSIRARFFVLFAKLIFLFKLHHLFFGRNCAYVKDQKTHLLHNYTKENFALFTGTEGPNRKLVLYSDQQFIKIALNEITTDLIENERKTIQSIGKAKCFKTPEYTEISKGILRLSDLGKNAVRSTEFSIIQAKALSEMYNIQPRQFLKFKDAACYNIALDQIQAMESLAHSKIPVYIIEKLKKIAVSVNETDMIFTMAHRDFTPWNCFVSRDKLHLYDFELAQDYLPFGFDAFHFVMQQGILVDRLPWKLLKPKLKEAYNHLIEHWDWKIGMWEECLKAYLLINLSYYLHLYSQQQNWHIQIQWLLNTWNDALSDLLQSKESPRELLITDVFDFLQNEHYAAIKFPDLMPQHLNENADIDLLMNPKTAIQLLAYLENHSLVSKINLQKQSNMMSMSLLAKDGSLLSLDLIWRLKRKGIQFMDSAKALKSSIMNSYGVRTLNGEDTRFYLQCFYGLNHSFIPEKYDCYFNNEKERAIDLKVILNKVLQMPQNKGISALKNQLNYLLDLLGRIRKQKGIIITFSGVDGAGKSTIIEHTKQQIEKKLRKRVVVIRHRPSILPILSAFTHGKEQAEKIAATKLPRQGTNNSLISSMFRFAYYYTDYLFGQFYIYLKYVLRGDVVLYDRYYFDFIIDSLRSNVRLPQWITKAGYKLLMQPSLNFFLYADAETILARKKELEPLAIENLTRDYLKLFGLLKRNNAERYFPIENNDLKNTLSFISNKAQTKLI
jgi:thymidylate kinase